MTDKFTAITCTRYGPVELYTPELLREFDQLTLRLSSPVQMTRITARLDLREFIVTHGRAVCDEMFEALKLRDSKGD